LEEDTFQAGFALPMPRAGDLWPLLFFIEQSVTTHLKLLKTEPPRVHVELESGNASYRRSSLAAARDALVSDEGHNVPDEWYITWVTPSLAVTVPHWRVDTEFRVKISGPNRLVVEQNKATLEDQVARFAARLAAGEVPAPVETTQIATAETLSPAAEPKPKRLPEWTNNSLIGGVLAGVLAPAILASLGWWGKLDAATSSKLLTSAYILGLTVLPIITWTLITSMGKRPVDPIGWWKLAGRMSLIWFAVCGVAAYGVGLWFLWA